MERKNAWLGYGARELKAVDQLAERYKKFISECKTERECVVRAIELAGQKGYKPLEQFVKAGKKLKAGDKIYAHIMGKSLVLFNIGRKPLEEGMTILGAHIDSPRLDLKPNPLYEDNDFVLLDTHYYGGVKKYQWVTLPMALHGTVAFKDGTVRNVVIGEDPSDPVVGVTDLLIHLAKDQMEKKGSVVIEGEDLDIMIGSRPVKGAEKEKELVKKNVLSILKDKYGMDEEDFISAEFEVVPAGPARDMGLDRSMIMGYGHDDRICAYTSLEAFLETDKLDKTGVCLLVDKEEIGSVGATGMHSRFFENCVAELINLCGSYSELTLKRAMSSSRMLSSDVSAGFDPTYASAFEKKNAAYLGRGLCFNKYTGARGKSGSNDAPAEYVAALRSILDENKVSWQISELGKVDQGGGGTIAYILANYGMEVIDSGIAVLNMHAPYEIASKADIYEAVKGYKAFLRNA
ncbi:MAG: aminopeptidase [Lachnospiraceae bacterium]|nr:aminopeptidase [Lachnospiraceae bacterium]